MKVEKSHSSEAGKGGANNGIFSSKGQFVLYCSQLSAYRLMKCSRPFEAN